MGESKTQLRNAQNWIKYAFSSLIFIFVNYTNVLSYYTLYASKL